MMDENDDGADEIESAARWAEDHREDLRPRSRSMKELQEENEQLQRLLVELTRPREASTKEFELMKTSDFLKAFYEERQLGSAPARQEARQQQQHQHNQPKPFSPYLHQPKDVPHANLLAAAKIPHTASSGAALHISSSGTGADLLHESRVRELTWKHAGTQSLHRSLPVTEKESLRLRPRGDGRSGAVDPVAVLPQIARQPVSFRPPPNMNRALDLSGPPQFASPGRAKTRGRAASAGSPSRSPTRSPSRSPSPMPATPTRASTPSLAPLSIPSSSSSSSSSSLIPLSPIHRPGTTQQTTRRSPASPSLHSHEAASDPSLLGERTDIDDYLSQLFSGGPLLPQALPAPSALPATDGLDAGRGRSPAFDTVHEASEGSEGLEGPEGLYRQEGLEGEAEGGYESHSPAVTTSSAAEAAPMPTTTATTTTTTTASANPLSYLPWKIAPHVPVTPLATAAPAPSDAEFRELSPVCSQLVDGLYKRSVVVSLLASKKPAWKVDAVQQYDPRLYLAPVPPPPDRMVIKVSDVVESTEVHCAINVREYAQLLYDLVDKHPALDIASHLQPSSLDWWRESMRYVIKLRSKPDGSLLVKISKGHMEKLCVSRAAGVGIEGLEVIDSESDLSEWMTSFYMRLAAKEKEARERAERDASLVVPPREPRGPVLGPASASPKKGRRDKRRVANHKAPRSPGGREGEDEHDEADARADTRSPISTHTHTHTHTASASDGPDEYDHETDGRGDATSTHAPALPKISVTAQEAVARKAITDARHHVSSSTKFRSRPLSDVEISLISSPFAVPLVTEKMKREKERILREQGLA